MNDESTPLGLRLSWLKRAFEIHQWAKDLDCTPHAVEAAIKVVGHSAEAVTRYLRQKSLPGPYDPQPRLIARNSRRDR